MTTLTSQTLSWRWLDDHRSANFSYPDKGIDFTWEREWRIRTEGLPLDPKITTLVVPSRDWEARVLDKGYGKIVELCAHFYAEIHVENEWHLIVLEDLGVGLPPSS